MSLELNKAEKGTTRIRNDVEHIYKNILETRFGWLKHVDVKGHIGTKISVGKFDAANIVDDSYHTIGEYNKIHLAHPKAIGSNYTDMLLDISEKKFEKVFGWASSVKKSRVNFMRHTLYHETGHAYRALPNSIKPLDHFIYQVLNPDTLTPYNVTHSLNRNIRPTKVQIREAQKIQRQYSTLDIGSWEDDMGWYKQDVDANESRKIIRTKVAERRISKIRERTSKLNFLGKSRIDEREPWIIWKSELLKHVGYRKIHEEKMADSFAMKHLANPNKPLAHLTAMERRIGITTGAKQIPTWESGWFHGTAKIFGDFSGTAKKSSGTLERSGAIYLTRSTNFANQYTKMDLHGGDLEKIHAEGLRPHVRPVEVKVNNTWDYMNPTHRGQIYDSVLGANIKKWGHAQPVNDIEKTTKMMLEHGSYKHIEPFFDKIISQGFDSIRFTEGGAENMAVFGNSNIRSKFRAAETAANVASNAVGSVKGKGIGNCLSKTYNTLKNVMRHAR